MADALVEGVSGALGGVALLQATTVKGKKGGEGKAGGAAAAPALSTIAQVQRVVETQGWRGLFRGLEAALVGTTVSQGVYFTLYSLLRGAAAGPGPDATLTVAQSLAVASLAGAGNVLVTNPIWVVATRMQMHRADTRKKDDDAARDPDEVEVPVTHRPSALAVIREVVHEYGPRGFWNGCQASLIMVINPTLQYTLYEWLGAIFALSSLAKAGATIVTYPMLTVKNRMMTARRGDAHMQYASVGDAVVKIWRAEGAAGYYQGVRPKLVQSVLAAALLFVAKEEIVQFTRVLLGRGAVAAKH
ncbi:hypothetical protein QBZ16_000948 [Prototheca wickerhamii]|uniref:Uncharacterized protein n=1 Tax=Prototheca wickerhamii TaxID=3111 RepID=A0AAD9IF74_PROWI|nr:hypothetical protein QBZ16_000948 [Prototheca wickerhamii]